MRKNGNSENAFHRRVQKFLSNSKCTKAKVCSICPSKNAFSFFPRWARRFFCSTESSGWRLPVFSSRISPWISINSIRYSIWSCIVFIIWRLSPLMSFITARNRLKVSVCFFTCHHLCYRSYYQAVMHGNIIYCEQRWIQIVVSFTAQNVPYGWI